jgi:phosphatidylglycerol:prolipoprotein diacylglycerol transferase
VYLPSLSPYAFTIGPFAIHWYSVFMALSILVGALYFVRVGRARGLLGDDSLFDLALATLVGGIVGARVGFVVFNDPSWFVTDPLQIVRVYQGGLSWHGALIGGLGAAAIYARVAKIRLNPLLDLAVPGVAFGYALVRIGNIFNHEVLGRISALPFGRWPAQLIGAAIGVALLIRFFSRDRRPNLAAGDQFWSFLFWHSLLRGAVEESVRDNPLFWVHYVNPTLGVGFITLTQWATVPLMAVTYLLWRRAVRRAEPRLALAGHPVTPVEAVPEPEANRAAPTAGAEAANDADDRPRAAEPSLAVADGTEPPPEAP